MDRNLKQVVGAFKCNTVLISRAFCIKFPKQKCAIIFYLVMLKQLNYFYLSSYFKSKEYI